MKRFLIALALLLCASGVTLVASELSDAKHSLKSAERELSFIISKRDRAQQKQDRLQAKYEDALAKMAANEDKPNSLAYKDAVKKSEEFPVKMEQNAQVLAALNRQVDSLQNVVSECESALAKLQQGDILEDRDEVVTEDVVEEPIVETIIEQPVEKEDKRETIELSVDDKSMDTNSVEGDTSSASKPSTFWGKVWSVIKTIFFIIVGIAIFSYFVWSGRKGPASRYSNGHGGYSKEYKHKLIAEKQAEIARLQQQIASARSSEHLRGSKKTKSDINMYKNEIARLRAEIASIKAK